MKTIGMALIFLTCSATGVIKSVEYMKEERELYSFILFIRYIKSEVVIYLTRQRDIFTSFENKILEENTFLPLLRQREITDEKSPLYYVFCECEDRLSLKSDARYVIREFAESFGRLSCGEQEEKCNTTLSALEEIYKKEKENNRTRAKLCRSVGCMVGVALVLLLV